MALEDFYPFVDGQIITAAQWNELFLAIQNGTFFLDTTEISNSIMTLSDRVTALEERMAVQESVKAWRMIREQFILTADQSFIDLAHVPLLDSENVILNGMSLSKNGVPISFVGDYWIDGSKINFTSDRILNNVAGDQVTVIYQFEVE